jgi:hypothetical protein
LNNPPSVARDFLFRMRINHSINKAITRNAIPTVTPTMVGTFEVELEDRMEAEFDDVTDCEDREDDVDERVIVGV